MITRVQRHMTLSRSPQGPGAVPPEALSGSGARSFAGGQAAKYFDNLALHAMAAGVIVDVLAAVSQILVSVIIM